MQTAHETATDLVTENRDKLDALAHELLEHEYLERNDLERILGPRPRSDMPKEQVVAHS